MIKKLVLEEEKAICHNCVEEEYLSYEILENGEVQYCSYCGEHLECYSIEKVAEKIDVAISQHYQKTSPDPDEWEEIMLRHSDEYEWYRHGDQICDLIVDIAGIPEKASKDAQMLLYEKHNNYGSDAMYEEPEYDLESHYISRDVNDEEWQLKWSNFEKSFIEDSRFFNNEGIKQFIELFVDIEKKRTSDGRSMVMEIGPDEKVSKLFRARIFYSEEAILDALSKPDKLLGPPGSKVATAGRMNARGISVFYGASDRKTSVAEVRPPVGSKICVAQFNIIRKLRILDIEALINIKEAGSIFDRGYRGRQEKSLFLRNLADRMKRPVLPDDEGLEYLVTQAFADFLSSNSSLNLDGIKYASVQSPGRSYNIVLFHKASLVSEDVFSPNSQISVSNNEWDDVEEKMVVSYAIYEEPIQIDPNLPIIRENLDDDLFDIRPRIDTENSLSKPLQIDIDSIQVHLVRAAKYTTDRFDVKRYKGRTN